MCWISPGPDQVFFNMVQGKDASMIRKPAEMKLEVREQMRGGQGKVTFQHLFAKEEIKAKTRLCARLLLPPGASIGMHRHDNEDELFVIVKGEGVIDDGQARTPVSAGDAILTGSGAAHALENAGTDTLEVLAIIMLYGAP
jgi:mannose-6-phosphate isomerase-like protein (cupin superfamily)